MCVRVRVLRVCMCVWGKEGHGMLLADWVQVGNEGVGEGAVIAEQASAGRERRARRVLGLTAQPPPSTALQPPPTAARPTADLRRVRVLRGGRQRRPLPPLPQRLDHLFGRLRHR
jgi:hypothetical protein